MLTWQAHPRAVTSLAFVPGASLLSTGTDGMVINWDATSGSENYTWNMSDAISQPTPSSLLQVAVDGTGRFAAVGIQGDGIRFFDANVGRDTNLVRFHEVYAMAPSAGRESLFVVARGHQPYSTIDTINLDTRVWEIGFAEGNVMAQSKDRLTGSRFGLAISPDGKQVIAGWTRYDWPSGTVASSAIKTTGSMFAVSPDGDKLFGVAGRQLMVWGFQVGAFRRKLKGHLAPITGLTATPDGRKLWTASADATVRRWDIDNYECDKCYGLKLGPLGCIAVSPDGLTAAAGSAHNGHIAVWDLD